MSKYNQWVKDLEAVPEKEQPAFIRRTLRNKKNLHIFGRFFFPNIIRGTEDVPECHLELIDEITKPDDSAIIFPRSFAKSTWIKIDTLHDIVYALEPVILYIGVTITDAGLHFETIKAELENNELLKSVYGDLAPAEGARWKDRHKWTDKHFETRNGINVVARGASKGRGVNIKSKRPTKIICDDIEEDEQVRKAERRAKLNRWLYFVIFNSTDSERSKIKMVGTVLHTDCEVLKFYKQHGGIFRAAIEDGKSIWPKVWPLKKLERKREKIGTRAFVQEYLNNPTNEEMANFKPIWIDDNTYVSLPKTKSLWRKVIAHDPQGGEKSTSDEFATTVLGWSKDDNHRYVIEQTCGRASRSDQVKAIVLAWVRHPEAHIVGIEKILNQTATYQLALDWKNRKVEIKGLEHIKNRNIPIKNIDPGGKDKVDRLQIHEPAFERGEIHLRPEMKTLRDQILFLGTDTIEHDDRADSLVMALDLSYTSAKGIVSDGDSVYNQRAKETIAGNIKKEQF